MEAIKKTIKEITALYRDPSRIKERSQKAKQIESLVKSMSNNRAQLAKIFTLLLGEQISPTGNCPAQRFPIGCMVVPETDTCGHKFIIGKAVLIDHTNGAGALRSNGCVGNTTIAVKDARCATDEEIDGFFECYNWNSGSSGITDFVAKLY